MTIPCPVSIMIYLGLQLNDATRACQGATPRLLYQEGHRSHLIKETQLACAHAETDNHHNTTHHATACMPPPFQVPLSRARLAAEGWR